jgi:hypothetical protein
MLRYLYMEEGNLFCFVIMIFSKPRCFRLCYGIFHQKFSISRGASTWFRMFVITMWNLLIIEPFFHWIKKKNQLGIVGKPSPSFDLIKLISKFWDLKCEQYYWIFSDDCFWKFKKIAKKGLEGKIQLNAFKLRPMT